jgi:hypothetical protein
MLKNGKSDRVLTGKYFSASHATPKTQRQAEKQIMKQREKRAWKKEAE